MECRARQAARKPTGQVRKTAADSTRNSLQGQSSCYYPTTSYCSNNYTPSCYYPATTCYSQPCYTPYSDYSDYCPPTDYCQSNDYCPPSDYCQPASYCPPSNYCPSGYGVNY